MDSNIASGIMGIVGTIAGTLLGWLLTKKKKGKIQVVTAVADRTFAESFLRNIQINVGLFNRGELVKAIHNFQGYIQIHNSREKIVLKSSESNTKALNVEPQKLQYASFSFSLFDTHVVTVRTGNNTVIHEVDVYLHFSDEQNKTHEIKCGPISPLKKHWTVV